VHNIFKKPTNNNSLFSVIFNIFSKQYNKWDNSQVYCILINREYLCIKLINVKKSAAVQKYSYNYWQTNTVKLGAKEIFKTSLSALIFYI
jgi:hypothetical protein